MKSQGGGVPRPLTTAEVMALGEANTPWWHWWLFSLVAVILSACVGGRVVWVVW